MNKFILFLCLIVLSSCSYPASSDVVIQQGGLVINNNTVYNVTNVTNVTNNNNNINANLSLLKDESFITNVTSINFIGDSVTIADNGNNTANITITGGSSPSSSSTYGVSVVTVAQQSDIVTTDAVVFSPTSLNFNVYENRPYVLYCDIMYTGAVATTGQAINLSTTSSMSNVYIMYDTWSTATARVGFSTNTFGTVLTGTGSGAAIIKPNRIQAYFIPTTNGTVNLSIRSEVALSATSLLRGSKCSLYDTINQTKVVQPYTEPPARAIQLTDIATTSNSLFSATNMSFNLSSGYSYTLYCDIMYTGAATTTGQAIQINTTAGTSNVYLMYDTWSTATASVGFSTNTFGTVLTGTGSGAAIIRPNRIQAYFETTSDGDLTLYVRSEVSASTSSFLSGSKCSLYNNTIS